MKKISLSCFVAVVALCVFSGCSPKQPEKDYTWLKQVWGTERNVY